MSVDVPTTRTPAQPAPASISDRRSVGRYLMLGAVAVAVLAAIVIRFAARSPLWLDETITVNIARLPLADIPGALRQDGAPPLTYVLLHYWIQLFGSSTTAVRVPSMPEAFIASQTAPRGGMTLQYASNIEPFAVRHDDAKITTVANAYPRAMAQYGLEMPTIDAPHHIAAPATTYATRTMSSEGPRAAGPR